MANFNKVLLIGNLTRDPQLSYLPSQTPVVDFGIAVNRRWTSKEGESKEETMFIDCRAFSRLAENINKYMKKGRSIFIEGRIVLDSWTAQDGTKRSKHRVQVDNCQFLGGAPGAPGAGADTAAESQAAPDDANQQGPAAAKTSGDDIPF
jgi:single-strand DNA-binding protein